VSIREDPQIIHDQAVFPGMGVSRRDVIGSVVLTDGKEYLTILNWLLTSGVETTNEI
jgi:hypothetical protein